MNLWEKVKEIVAGETHVPEKGGLINAVEDGINPPKEKRMATIVDTEEVDNGLPKDEVMPE